MKKTYVVVRNGHVMYVTRLKKRDVWLNGHKYVLVTSVPRRLLKLPRLCYDWFRRRKA